MARTWTAWIFTSSAQNKSPLQWKVPRRRRFKNVQFSSWSKAEQCRVDLKLNKRKKKKGKTYKKSVFEVDAFFAHLEGDQNLAVAGWSQRAVLNTRSSLTWTGGGDGTYRYPFVTSSGELKSRPATTGERWDFSRLPGGSSPTGWTHIVRKHVWEICILSSATCKGQASLWT